MTAMTVSSSMNGTLIAPGWLEPQPGDGTPDVGQLLDRYERRATGGTNSRSATLTPPPDSIRRAWASSHSEGERAASV